MRNRKEELKKFFIWMRNGTSFCFTWFLILILAYHSFYEISAISTAKLIQVLFFCIGAVAVFCLFFTGILLWRWSFTQRLTGFMVMFSIYECICFYRMEFFQTSGSILEWTVFAGIILLLYFICLILYQIYSKKQGALYTQSLQKYQEKRRLEHEHEKRKNK